MVFKDDDEDEKQPSPKRSHYPANEAVVEFLQLVSKWEIVGRGASLSFVFKGITTLDPSSKWGGNATHKIFAVGGGPGAGGLQPMGRPPLAGGFSGSAPEAKKQM